MSGWDTSSRPGWGSQDGREENEAFSAPDPFAGGDGPWFNPSSPLDAAGWDGPAPDMALPPLPKRDGDAVGRGRHAASAPSASPQADAMAADDGLGAGSPPGAQRAPGWDAPGWDTVPGWDSAAVRDNSLGGGAGAAVNGLPGRGRGGPLEAAPWEEQPGPGHPDPGYPDPGHPGPGHPGSGYSDPGHQDLGTQGFGGGPEPAAADGRDTERDARMDPALRDFFAPAQPYRPARNGVPGREPGGRGGGYGGGARGQDRSGPYPGARGNDRLAGTDPWPDAGQAGADSWGNGGQAGADSWGNGGQAGADSWGNGGQAGADPWASAGPVAADSWGNAGPAGADPWADQSPRPPGPAGQYPGPSRPARPTRPAPGRPAPGRPAAGRPAPRRPVPSRRAERGRTRLAVIGVVALIVVGGGGYLLLRSSGSGNAAAGGGGQPTTSQAASSPSASPAAKKSGGTKSGSSGKSSGSGKSGSVTGKAAGYTLATPATAGGYKRGQAPSDLASATTLAKQVASSVTSAHAGTMSGNPVSAAYQLPDYSQVMTFFGYNGTFDPAKVMSALQSLGSDQHSYSAGSHGGKLACFTTSDNVTLCVWATTSTFGVTEFFSTAGPETLTTAQPKGASDTAALRSGVEVKS